MKKKEDTIGWRKRDEKKKRREEEEEEEEEDRRSDEEGQPAQCDDALALQRLGAADDLFVALHE